MTGGHHPRHTFGIYKRQARVAAESSGLRIEEARHQARFESPVV
jgi:hypothetical protein